MRTFPVGSAFLALALAATPAFSQTATVAPAALEQMVTAVTMDPASLETMVAAAVATHPMAAREIVGTLTKAFPANAAKITESAVAALAVNLTSGELSLAVSGVLESTVLKLADGRLAKGDLNNAIAECLVATESALNGAGLSKDFAQQTAVAASAKLAARLPSAEIGSALAAPVGDSKPSGQ
jgi:hypothetical protein